VVCKRAEAVAYVRPAPPVLVLPSHELPDQCGLSVGQQVQGLNRRIPVIFVTGSREVKGVIEAMKPGAFDYRFEPLDPHLLQHVGAEAREVARRLGGTRIRTASPRPRIRREERP
jgi:DNA-binding NtrC family response regulator